MTSGAVQAVLDRSMDEAGPHLREVLTPEHTTRCQRTVRPAHRHATAGPGHGDTADNRPLVGPVDGIFYRGSFHFGSAPDSVRIRHIRHRPQVSATHLPGEELAVTVHGRATLLDMQDPANAGLRQVVLGIYTPRFGPRWEAFLDANVYARIDAERIFTFHLD